MSTSNVTPQIEGLPPGSTVRPLPQIEGLPAGSTVKQLQPAGEQTNEIGKTVIVPKDGESFSDTMARAALHGKSVTQQDINDEMATAPGKAATVIGAAPVIGAAGAAALAGAGAAPGAAAKALTPSQLSLPGLGLSEGASSIVQTALRGAKALSTLSNIQRAGIGTLVLKELGITPKHILHLVGLMDE